MSEIYLDNAATSHPKPRCVIDGVTDGLTYLNANPGRSGHARAIRAAEEVLSARESAARLLGANDPFNVVFAFNCTDALNLAIKGSLKSGDHAICSYLEHNSVLRVLNGMAKDGFIELTMVKPLPNGFIDPAEIVKALRANTRLIVLTHASNVTGAIQPVKAVGRIARANGIPFLVDGAQVLGGMDVNVNDIMCDLYAFAGHKSPLGPQGTGGLYIRDGIRLKTLREGGTGSVSESMIQPDELPDRYESGTLNLHGLAGLRAGAEYVFRNLSKIRRTEESICAHIYEGLKAMEGITVYTPEAHTDRIGIVSFNIADMHSGQAADALSRRGICVRGGLHCAPGAHEVLGTIKRGAVRASVGYANTHAHAEALLSAVRDILKNEA